MYRGAFLTLALLFGACSLTDSEGEIVEAIGVMQLNSVRVERSNIAIEAESGWPNGCGQFSHFDVRPVQARHYDVTMYGKQKPGNCMTVNISIRGTLSVPVSSPGTYTFRFHQMPGQALDTTVVVGQR